MIVLDSLVLSTFQFFVSSLVIDDRLHPYALRNPATVPQIAMQTPRVRSPPSKTLQRPPSMILAETGPITHIIKAENEPRKAIIELKSGMRIENRTERRVTATL